ncbi:outer membrane protein assembly factor BamA [Mariluticola halotolerans]|uniref:outer membrane protein assembly factor BamA n=1 Tax=Mariluticola halotolerans TaxID=2909283 RepID=UPI0026E20F48|nr:outer membrane protein assembly factor BamA [Mariluticola halotolerans]UJQ94958.1 outer membrane protein assembly factor BamA [Mariluticola halotolerans]
MMHHSTLLRSLFVAFAFLVLAPLAGAGGLVFGVEAAQAQTVSRISVEGNSLVDDATVVSYLTVRVGDRAPSSEINASTNSLLASGLFDTVNVRLSGGVLRVSVSENPVVASVLFEGNQRFSDKELLSMVDTASRGVFTREGLSTDEQSIRIAYDQAGYTNVTVAARTEVLANQRVRVVFVVNEGERAGITAINFTGNNTYDSNQLKTVISTKESHWLSWLLRDDTYEEDKLAYDSELIRRFYADRGYPDAQVLSAVADFDTSKNAYFVNFTVSEGEYYSFGNIAIETSISGLDTGPLQSVVRTREGSRYSASRLQQSANEMAIRATEQGYAFADVRPRVERDVASHTFNITYLVDEGARIYVERVNILGNEKTRDFVIRRELGFAEGDPFNRSIISRGKTAIEDLGFFSSVDVSTSPGSAADKIVIDIAVVEDSTGDYGATVGYATEGGVLGELSLTERNFLGRGQYVRAAIGASQSGRTFDFSFTEPRFMGLKISTGFDIYKRVNDETTASFYGSDVVGGKIRLGVPLTKEFSSTFFVGLENTQYTDKKAPASVIVTDGETRNKVFVGYSLNYNGVDSVKKPTEGLYASFSQQYVGWDNNYVKSELKARYFMPLMEDSGFIASVKGQVGVVNSVNGTGVNPTETFLLGPSLVRGFEGRGFGPRRASGEALGSTYYAGLSAEIEFPFPVLPESYGLTGAVWADVGYAGDESSAGPAAQTGIAQQVRSSIGASIIWDSPFGPLRGDFAHVLQKDSADKTQVFQLTLKSLL